MLTNIVFFIVSIYKEGFNMAKVDKVMVAVSRGNYTVYTQRGKLFGEETYNGHSHSEMEAKKKETSRRFSAKSQYMPYEVLGKRRSIADAVASFAEDKYFMIRKDLLPRALTIVGVPEEELSVVYNGPFAYVRAKA